MKKIVFTLTLFIVLTQTTYSQACKASIKASIPQCQYQFESTVEPNQVLTWKINGKEYGNRKSIRFFLDHFDTFRVRLIVRDTVKNCADSTEEVFPGEEKLKFDYYSYKNRLYVTRIGQSQDTHARYIIDWGNGYTTDGREGFFAYTYDKPGRYPVYVTMFDSINALDSTRKYNRFCPRIGGDTLTISSDSQCRSFFVFRTSLYLKDTIILVNRAVGERLKYKWNFGDGTTSTQRFTVHSYNMVRKVPICLTVTDSLTKCTSTYCDTFILPGQKNTVVLTVGGTTYKPSDHVSIRKIAQAQKVRISPNPFHNTVKLRFDTNVESVSWEVFSLLGKRVLKGSEESVGKDLELDLTALNNEMYILRLHFLNHSETVRITKLD